MNLPAQIQKAPRPAQTATKATALDKAVLEDYVRRLFVWNAQVQVKVEDPVPSPLDGFVQIDVVASNGKAAQRESFYVSKDGQQIVRGLIFKVDSSPFAADLDKLKTAGQPSLGMSTAPVQIVVFSDFECAFCKEEAKTLRTNVVNTYPAEVRIVFKDFPLETIHPWALNAAVAGRCVYHQQPESFWDYHDWIFEHQTEINSDNLKGKMVEFVKSKKLDEPKFVSCFDGQVTKPEIAASQEEGKSLQIDSTPTAFINGRRIPGNLPWPQLRQIIDYELEYEKAHSAGSGEKCCEVSVPSPVKP